MVDGTEVLFVDLGATLDLTVPGGICEIPQDVVDFGHVLGIV